MPRFRATQLQQFRRSSRCEDCVHYAKGCPLWMAVLLSNEEDMSTPGLDLFIDIDAPCPMFFHAASLQTQRAATVRNIFTKKYFDERHASLGYEKPHLT